MAKKIHLNEVKKSFTNESDTVDEVFLKGIFIGCFLAHSLDEGARFTHGWPILLIKRNIIKKMKESIGKKISGSKDCITIEKIEILLEWFDQGGDKCLLPLFKE
jgi:hypothetical protein